LLADEPASSVIVFSDSALGKWETGLRLGQPPCHKVVVTDRDSPGRRGYAPLRSPPPGVCSLKAPSRRACRRSRLRRKTRWAEVAFYVGRIQSVGLIRNVRHSQKMRRCVGPKENLPHGEFLAMVEQALPFSARTAQLLVAVAKDRRPTDAKYVSLLPSHWGTLYELTKPDDEGFAGAIADGTIRPDMERAEISARVKQKRHIARPRPSSAPGRRRSRSETEPAEDRAFGREVPSYLGPIEGHGEEEAQRRYRAIDGRRPHAGLRLMQLEAAQILSGCRIRRAVDEGCEGPDVPDIIVARLLIARR
jgi:hypothetical protein